jgi:hypothetical protein
MANRYYLTQRGPGPGVVPRNKENLITEVEDFEVKKYVEEINLRAWGFVEYEKPLTSKEIDDYELIEVKIGVPFNEKLEFNCNDCCKNCDAEQCPNNETRCQ